MKLKDKLQESLSGIMSEELLNKLPSGYSVIGDIAIFRRLNPEIDSYKKNIGECVISFDPQVKVVIEQFDTISAYRKPIISHMAGEKKTETTHKEFNTLFNLDLETITFSPGNKSERCHLIKTVEDNEIICDMFACIGNLSLPIVVNNSSVTVYGMEWNQTALNFLKKNIDVNKVGEQYISQFGDNREITPKNIATRVIMGYFDIDKKQFYVALEAIKDQGWIHFHRLAPRDKLDQPIEIIEKERKISNHKIETQEVRIIKKYSPRLYHLCSDIYVKKFLN
ncbi:MAG: hypothetical protein KGD64_03345 [Candidatus Heimdallarchaeota archaeon]|nr:hypothetical protein [Candidatus Heimdallarchaeota archaeon]